MKNNATLPTLTIVALAALAPISSPMAQPNNPKIFGKDAPFQITDLPPQSRLRKSLEGLPVAAKNRALKNLHEFSFPENDVTAIQADPEGGIYYVDSALPESVTSVDTTTLSTAGTLPTVDVFKLHSKQGSTRTVFLDFDGHVITGTAWNSTSYPTYNAQPFDSDGFPGSFSADERSKIQEIWQRMAEDYAPFDIDVTTEQPASFGPTVGRVLFTPNVDLNGNPMPYNTSGGIAYVNVWGLSNYASSYSPALVYSNNLGPNHAPYMAEAGSHEFGHNLGLSHDGVSDGTFNTLCPGSIDYYCGLGSGLVSWGPIMGVGYFTNVTEWSRGEYPAANNTAQDDLAIISSKLTYRSDDRGNTILASTPLVIDSTGIISATTPLNDPANTAPSNKGIIETSTDVDVYAFDAAAGPATITVTPAWVGLTSTGSGNSRGANLDVRATLYDAAGTVIVSDDPVNDTKATLSATLSGGHYYIGISAVGNAISPYSTYNSMGKYFIAGSVIAATVVADTTPPLPNAMTFAVAPYAVSPYQITMTATTATDPSGGVQYQFQCASGTGCVDSAWQTATSYSAAGLASNTTYGYKVVAKDALGNITGASAIMQATTPSASTVTVTTSLDTAPAAPSNMAGKALKGRKISLTWQDNANNETAMVLERAVNNGSFATRATLAANSIAYTDSGLTAGTKYTYRLNASNSAGSSSYSNTAGPITATK